MYISALLIFWYLVVGLIIIEFSQFRNVICSYGGWFLHRQVPLKWTYKLTWMGTHTLVLLLCSIARIVVNWVQARNSFGPWFFFFFWRLAKSLDYYLVWAFLAQQIGSNCGCKTKSNYDGEAAQLCLSNIIQTSWINYNHNLRRHTSFWISYIYRWCQKINMVGKKFINKI